MTLLSRVPDSGWGLPDEACWLLAELVAEHKPQLILECGSGRSTVALAEAAGHYDGRVVSLEHDPGYANQTRALLREHNLSIRADVRLAPLEPWYDRRAWADLHGIGLLLVDGPPGHLAPQARGSALPLLRDRLLPGCVVILDDVDREDEQTIMRDWAIDMTCVKHAKAWIAYGALDG